ncbi:unnamed protein product [Sphagnum compactum]|jgi:hypothetical protein
MLDVALRMRALSLYRALMRSVRTWPGPSNEKQYIYEESHTLFRRNQHLTDPAAISQKLVEGETRYQIAWHYKIPYPRLHNLPTGTITDSPQRISKPTYEVPSQEMGSLDDDQDSVPGLDGSRRMFQGL